MSVLVATDFSPCSQAAVRLAAAIAQQRAVPLIVVHAVEEPALDEGIPTGPAGLERNLLMAAETAIAREVRVLRERGIAVQTRVELGNPFETIHELVIAQRPELVVVGTHGRKGVARFFLGSVAESVVRKSACPVLVTGEGVTDLERWSGQGPLRLAIATDGSYASQAALSWMRGFEASRPCDLSIIRLYWPAETAQHYGLDDPWAAGPRGAELVKLIERDLKRDAETALGRVPSFRLRVASNDGAEALTDEAALLDVDGVVIGIPRHRSSRWAAIAPAAVLRSGSVPILCIPEAAAPAARELPRTTSILVPTDFSDASREAILPAYGLLRSGGGRVELCTVHVPSPPTTPESPGGPPLGAAERGAAESRLRSLIPPEAEAAGITTSVSVFEGHSVPETIVAAAERLGVDVVAIGSHGRSGFKRAVLGSVADEVARHCPRPVLIVGGARQTRR
jgi:nucleotide-binding universal stress UspA family protein